MLDDESQDATLETEDSAEDTSADTDWRKRYTDTQAEYTRNQQALAEERKVWEDEQALLARVQEKFPHLLAEEDETEDDDDFEDDTPDASQFATRKELEEFKAWQRQVDAERGESLYKQHLAEELGEREVPEKVHDWIRDRTIALGGNRQALKKAVEEFDSISEQLAQSKKKKPRVPHVPQSGRAGSEVKDWSQMSRDQQIDHMVERARALEA